MSNSIQSDPQDMGVVALTVEALAAGGRGVARHRGRVWFVPGTVPGDRVEARGVRDHGRWVEGRVLRWERRSPDRRLPPCPSHPACGGCPWMGLDEGLQRQWKARIVSDALRRIGGARELPELLVQEVGEPLRYRNRVEFAVTPQSGGGFQVGLRPAAGDGLVEPRHCLLLPPPGEELLARARAALADAAGPDPGDRGELRLLLRVSAAGEWLVVLRESGEARFPAAAELASKLFDPAGPVAGVLLVRADPGRRGGAHQEILAGRDWLHERICGFDFALPATTFVQVSHAAATALTATVAARAATGSVFDVYGGVGLHALNLARAGADRAAVFEADRRAAAAGRSAARAAGLADRVSYVEGNVARTGPAWDGFRPELVVTNPPRAGMARAVLDWIARLSPGRLIYISCDPATLARDLGRLGRQGYRITSLEAFDLFPQTAHVETVVTLEAAVHRPHPPGAFRR